MSDKASQEIMRLFFTPDEELYGKPVTDMKLNFMERAVLGKVLKKLDGTDIATLLREYHVI